MSLTSQAPLRMGIIGVGAMGKDQIRSVAMMGQDEARIVAVYDPDAQTRDEAISELGAHSETCKAFGSWGDLLMSDSVDAVVICGPDLVDILRQAVRSTNKHILSETPSCTAMSDCFEVERLKAERGKASTDSDQQPGIFTTGLQYKWMPHSAAWYELRDFVKAAHAAR
jgi:predicted dehydrogenase